MTETLSGRIIRHEGIRLKPYRDTLGNWTIGVGHEITPEQATGEYGNGLTEDQAMEMLEDDINKAQVEVNALQWTSSLCQIRQEVLIEMVFQLGMAGVMKFTDFLFRVRSGDWDGAAHAMLDSLWHRETPERCEELAHLMLTGGDADD